MEVTECATYRDRRNQPLTSARPPDGRFFYFIPPHRSLKAMPTPKMLFAQLGTGDVDEVCQLLTDDHIQGIHKPSWYTISSIVNLYGEICGAIRIDGTLKAVSLNCPYLKNDGVYVYLFAVGIGQQRKGIGSYLFASMVKMLREKGYRKISLRALKSNQDALRFWLARGFIGLPAQVSDDVDAFAENFLERAL